MKTYKNISAAWGDAVGGLTIEDYRKQAIVFGDNPDNISADEYHIFYGEEIVADAE